MSFGFSIGDLIVVYELASKIRKQFVDSPGQFKAISDEVKSLSNVVRDVEDVLPNRELTDQQKTTLHDILEGCRNVLIALDRVVDEYCGLGISPKGFGDKSRRVWKRLKFEPDDIRDLRSRISSNIELLNAFNTNLTVELSSAIKDGMDQLNRRQHNQECRHEHQIIVDWLTPIDYAPQQSDFVARRQEGTGQWLLDSKEFNEWLDQSKQTLFCPGIPGAGKTIITSIVVHHLHTKFRSDPTVGIAYLYCDFRRQHEQKPTDLLLNLLKQLVQEQSSIPESVKNLFTHHKGKRTRPSFDEISKVMYPILADYSRSFIIINALDECQATDGSRSKLLSEILNLQAKTGAGLFITSRYLPEIMKEFEGSTSLEIRASDEDVLRYIDGRISWLLRSRILKYQGLQNTIRKEVLKAVDGMFLLAKLHMSSLMSKLTPGDIKVALKNLPRGEQGLDATYEQAMERIEGQEADFRMLARQVLSWVIHTKRPLSGQELRHALSVRTRMSKLDDDFLPELEDLVSVCAGLVTVDEESDIIRLVHYTTQEYFGRTGAFWFPFAQTDITKTCVTYLSFDNFETGFCPTDEEFETRLRSNALYDYAARNWGHHARVATTEMAKSILGLLESEAKVSACSQAMTASGSYSGYSQGVPKRITGVHLAAYFGLKEAMMVLLRNGHHLDSKDTYGRTPLWWAAGNGHEGVVKLLLDKGAELEAKDRKRGQTPLSWAAENGHEAVVKLLLDKDAELESKDSKKGRTPLSWAAENGHEAVVKLLLDKDAELESKDSKKGRAPLSWAAMNGHEAVVKLLLDKDAELESKDRKRGQTPLSWAAENGHEAVVKLLLNKGAELESKDRKWGRTPLLWAARNRDEAVMKLLLEKGAKLESKDSKRGRTPLSWAAEYGRKAVVKLLLEKGAELKSKDSEWGRTPLSWAAGSGHWAAGSEREAVMKLLLEKDAELESKDGRWSRTPLSWAAGYGREMAVKLLLEKGAEPESKDSKWGRTPLLWATENGHEAVVKLLQLHA